MIAEEGFPPVYPTNGMKKVTGALLAVPTGVEVKIDPPDDGSGDVVGEEPQLDKKPLIAL